MKYFLPEKNVLGAQALGIHGILYKDIRATLVEIEKLLNP